MFHIDLKALKFVHINNMSLNVSKAEVLVKLKRKLVDSDMKITLRGKRLHSANSVKHVGFKNDS